MTRTLEVPAGVPSRMAGRRRKPQPQAAAVPGAVAATPIAFVRAIVAAYDQRGMGAEAALAHARIPAAQLDDDAACVTAAQFEALSFVAMQQLDDEAPGWFSRRLPWGSYGLLCRASVTAPRLGIALARWCRHHALLTDDVQLTLHDSPGGASLVIAERRDLGRFREFCLLTLLRYLHGFACWATDSRIGLSAVQFPFAAPAHAAVYPLLFPGPVGFDAPTAGFAFDSAYLALPLVRDEASTRAMLRRALPLTVRPYRRDRLLVERVRSLLRQQPQAARGPTSLPRSCTCPPARSTAS